MSMSSILAAGGRYVCAVVDTVQVTPNRGNVTVNRCRAGGRGASASRSSASDAKRRRLSRHESQWPPKELAWETKAAKKTRQKASSSESTNRKKNNKRNRIRTSRELREDGLNE